MSSKRRLWRRAGVMRRTSWPGACTTTRFSVPISDVTFSIRDQDTLGLLVWPQGRDNPSIGELPTGVNRCLLVLIHALAQRCQIGRAHCVKCASVLRRAHQVRKLFGLAIARPIGLRRGLLIFELLDLFIRTVLFVIIVFIIVF